MKNDNTEKCTQEAIKIHQNHYGSPKNIKCTSLIETFNDASCGFGGMAAQTLTDIDVIVVQIDKNTNHVFIGGEYAYTVDKNNLFQQRLKSQTVPGRDACHEIGGKILENNA